MLWVYQPLYPSTPDVTTLNAESGHVAIIGSHVTFKVRLDAISGHVAIIGIPARASFSQFPPCPEDEGCCLLIIND